MNYVELNQILTKAIQKSFALSDISADLKPSESIYGDYTSTAPLRLAKRLKMTPKEVGAAILIGLKHPMIERVELEGAGFLNITMTKAYWAEQLSAIDQDFGRIDLGHRQKTQIEFISANPTGPLTLGNARGGFYGDVLANLGEFTGFKITKEYYFNDSGSQIKALVGSIKAQAGLGTDGESQYSGEYIKKLAGELKTALATKSDEELNSLITGTIIERYIKPAIKRMNIEFDVWFNEKTLSTSGQFSRSLERLDKLGLIYEADGAVWLKSTTLGDYQDRVLVKSTGEVTYLGNDIAYHIDIFEERDFATSYKIWGADHMSNMKSLQVVMEKLFPDKKLIVIINQFVRLIKDGQEYKISKRAGTFVTVDELIDQVGPDVARFFFLMHSHSTHMDFDLDLAVDSSAKNPLHYLMYSYARANSIMEQALARKMSPAKSLSQPTTKEIALIKQMSWWPELIKTMAADYGLHRLSFFGLELAKHFHDFYESEHILSLEKSVAEEKLYLVQQYLNLFKVYFKLFGLTPKAKM